MVWDGVWVNLGYIAGWPYVKVILVCYLRSFVYIAGEYALHPKFGSGDVETADTAKHVSKPEWKVARPVRQNPASRTIALPITLARDRVNNPPTCHRQTRWLSFPGIPSPGTEYSGGAPWWQRKAPR